MLLGGGAKGSDTHDQVVGEVGDSLGAPRGDELVFTKRRLEVSRHQPLVGVVNAARSDARGIRETRYGVPRALAIVPCDQSTTSVELSTREALK